MAQIMDDHVMSGHLLRVGDRCPDEFTVRLRVTSVQRPDTADESSCADDQSARPQR